MDRIDELINAAQWSALRAEEVDELRLQVGDLRYKLKAAKDATLSARRELRDYRTTNTWLVLENGRLTQELVEMQQELAETEEQLRAVALHKFATAPVFHIPAELLDDDETPFPQ